MDETFQLITDRLVENHFVSDDQLLYLLRYAQGVEQAYLFEKASEVRVRHFGRNVYFRGLIEISNYCRCNCLYCGIRSGNLDTIRFRLTDDEIVGCCGKGYDLGYRSFVLQGGEDPHFSDERLERLIRTIHSACPDCAITLSLGERSNESYKRLYQAGADRYLLRHETANARLYQSLHPNASFEHRRFCLQSLKEIGFQTGAGFLVGLPGYTNEDYLSDLLYLKQLQPEMVGIGPFIPQKDTPMSHLPAGSVEKTLVMLSLVRLLLHDVLLPATTALATLDEGGRVKGFHAGANVIMPNLSPYENRVKYALYDGKKFTDNEAAEELMNIQKQIVDAGFIPCMERGDHVRWNRI